MWPDPHSIGPAAGIDVSIGTVDMDTWFGAEPAPLGAALPHRAAKYEMGS